MRDLTAEIINTNTKIKNPKQYKMIKSLMIDRTDSCRCETVGRGNLSDSTRLHRFAQNDKA